MEFKEYKLGDLVESISDTTKICKPKVILINTSDVENGKVLNHSYVDNINLRGQFKKRFKKGDILYSEIRPKNRRFAFVKFEADDYIASTKLMILRKKSDDIDNDYLFYILSSNSIINQLQNLAELRSGTFPQITFKELSELTVKIPSLTHQRRTVKILTAIDKKVELNNKINTNLQNLAQEIYKRWFVNFEFPNDQGNTFKSSGGNMVKSELGDIPEEFTLTEIGSFAKCVLGGTPSRNILEYWNGNISWINSGEVNNFRIINPTEYITELGLLKSSTYLLPKGTTVIAITGATLGQVSLLEIDSCANQSVIGILEKEAKTARYIYLMVVNNIFQIIKSQTGGAQQHINKNDVEKFKFILPSRMVLDRFDNIIDPLFKKISNNCFENKNLINLRNTILPKLINGELI